MKNEAKVTFYMLEFSRSMIIGRNLMVQLGISADLKHKFLQWDSDTVPTKEPRSMLGKTYLTSRKMRKVAMKTT